MRIEKPLSQEQLKQGDLAPKGDYPFLIVEAEEATSKTSGADMIKLKVKVYADRERFVFDYLLEALSFKMGHFCEATGLIDKYQEGVLSAHDCEGKTGYLKLGIDDGSKSGYAPKNVVLDYIPSDEALAEKSSAKAKAASPGVEFEDSDLPF